MMLPRSRAVWLACVLLLALPLLILLATSYSETGFFSPSDTLRMLLYEMGETSRAEILRLRLMRALCAAGVGGTLAIAGAMTQGLFRNPIAEPGVLGVSSGAALGAILGIAVLGGYGPQISVWKSSNSESLATHASGAAQTVSLMVIPCLALVGAFVISLIVYRFATRHGRVSIPTLLLAGIAMNAILAGMMAAVQVLLLQDWQVSRAIVAWGFGTLEDRTLFHLGLVWIGGLLALSIVPFVGLELDLMAGGEEDSAALGADPARIKIIVLIAVATATAASVAVAGQIGFVGLLVPHITRIIVGPHHRTLLPLSFLFGATLLVAVVVLQHGACWKVGEWLAAGGFEHVGRMFKRFVALQPGVITSLLGAPVFLYLLLKQERKGLW